LSPLEALPSIPRDRGEPVFGEPWEAKAFALAVALHERGVFTWPEWAEALGSEIAAAPADSGTHYYESWLNALETMLRRKGVAQA
jgi:nitrile hydratase accessory protein